MTDNRTTELRRLLDARGVEYEANRLDFDDGNYNIYTEWGDISYVEYADGTVLRIFDCTSEQAIAATLGSGTCSMEYGGDVTDSTKRVLGVYFCSECGSPTYNDTMPYYCMYCGKAVKR